MGSLMSDSSLTECVCIVTEGRIYASVKYAIIGAYNGLSPTRPQVIIYTNASLLLI